MSIYTPVDADTLQQILNQYQAGTLVGYEILPGGAVNTNYSVLTDKGHFVLTLFESLSSEEASQFLSLLNWLTEQKMPGAKPYQTENGQWLDTAFRRPCSLVSFLSGTHPACPRPGQCEAIGTYLGQLHSLNNPPPLPKEAFDFEARTKTARLIAPMLSKKSAALLDAALAFDRPFEAELPCGLLHGDLFRDNSLFEGDHLIGVIDFYFAFTGPYLFDLAIVLNDWACTSTGKCHTKRAQLILNSYEKIRPLTTKERALLGPYRILAALRFWLSRLEANLLPQGGTQLPIRDPTVFESRLKALLEFYS